MRVVRHVSEVTHTGRPRVAAAGRFDGVHRGHQRLLAQVVHMASVVGGESVVIVAPRGGDALSLLDARQRLERLRDSGIDLVVFAPAAEIDAAVDRVAVARRLTARGSGTPAPIGGRLEEIEPVQINGAPISSAAIHGALAGGDLDTVRALLGRDPSVGGRVVHGFHRGAPLGIPTANLRVRGVRLPPDGVYAVWARSGGERLQGVANIGFNPTFGNRTRTLETHVLDFSGDLYGRRLDVGFVARLRGEQKFPDVAALLAQIRADIGAARRLFAAHA
jgi:riboflavin kinase/FMN adenylyltransferase